MYITRTSNSNTLFLDLSSQFLTLLHHQQSSWGIQIQVNPCHLWATAARIRGSESGVGLSVGRRVSDRRMSERRVLEPPESQSGSAIQVRRRARARQSRLARLRRRRWGSTGRAVSTLELEHSGWERGRAAVEPSRRRRWHSLRWGWGMDWTPLRRCGAGGWPGGGWDLGLAGSSAYILR